MTPAVEWILIFLILTNLVLVGSSRLAFCLRILAAQGFAVGLFPLFLVGHELTVRVFLLAVMSVALKGIVFPWFLFRALRAAGVRHEVEPLVGYTLSILTGVFGLVISLWLASQSPLPALTTVPLILPTALFTVMIGLFLIVSRSVALNQVVGYLVLENGIYLFGITLAREQPFLIETGVLLDVFAAVFVMGITMFHISREFDHIDVDQLTQLKD